MSCFIFHKWLPWTRPIATYKIGQKQQWRECATCKIAQFRTLGYDEQSNVQDINAALDAAALQHATLEQSETEETTDHA